MFTGQEELSDVVEQLQSIGMTVEDWVDDFYKKLNDDGKMKYTTFTSPLMRKAASKTFQNILDSSSNVDGTSSVFQLNDVAAATDDIDHVAAETAVATDGGTKSYEEAEVLKVSGQNSAKKHSANTWQ